MAPYARAMGGERVAARVAAPDRALDPAPASRPRVPVRATTIGSRNGVPRTASSRARNALPTGRRPSQVPARNHDTASVRPSATVAAGAVSEVLRQPGEPLDPRVRRRVEPSFGLSFEGVRVHRDAPADRSARAIGARAYTAGPHLVFRTGAYAPDTFDGMQTLVHELTHVVQQHRGPVTGAPAGGGLVLSDPSDRFEHEARCRVCTVLPERSTAAPTSTADPISTGRIGVASTTPAPVIQRFESYEHVQLGDTAPGSPTGGFIVLDAHRRDLPNHATPTAGWPQEWVDRWNHGTPDQQRAIRDGLTYGEVLALAGDLYASVDTHGTTNIAQSVQRLDQASLLEIWGLIPLIHGQHTSTADFEQATGGRYMNLAERNLSHFSNVPVGQRNMDVWRDGHAQAIRLARGGQAGPAWLASAAADHFLTDAFAGGHLREARASLISSTRGQIEAKVEHDLDNSHGVDVTNSRGDRWIAYGDDHLNDAVDACNRQLATEAETLSKADVADALARRSAYPDPPSPVPPGTFAAEAIVPHPVNAAAQRWGAWDRMGEMAHLSGSELPEQVTPNGDTRIRAWVAHQSPAALQVVPLDEKLRMINRLLDGWVSGDDLDAVARICTNTSSSDMLQIERAITPRVASLTDLGQRSRLRAMGFE